MIEVRFFKGSQQRGVSLSLSLSPPSHEDGNRSSFRNVVFSSNLEFHTKFKARKSSYSEQTVINIIILSVLSNVFMYLGTIH
jgi:hypothetical protein